MGRVVKYEKMQMERFLNIQWIAIPVGLLDPYPCSSFPSASYYCPYSLTFTYVLPLMQSTVLKNITLLYSYPRYSQKKRFYKIAAS